VVILLVTFNGFFLLAIDGTILSMVITVTILLMAFDGYSIGGYWWLF
jgi:hypothetical protein